jgi:glyoxylase I family protein
MKLEKIHHIAIICSDYEKSKLFYVQILGLKILSEVYRPDRKSYKLDLAVGDEQIELFSFPDPPPRLSFPEARGLRHLAFQVDDVDLAVRELTAKGVPVEHVRIDEVTGKRFVFFADPYELPLELYEL